MEVNIINDDGFGFAENSDEDLRNAIASDDDETLLNEDGFCLTNFFDVALLEKIDNLMQIKDEASLENALELNRLIQNCLNNLKVAIIQTSTSLKRRYERNEKLFNNANSVKVQRDRLINRNTIFSHGNLFFKDMKNRPCPCNSDYQQRLTRGEMFPMDLEMIGRHVWSLQDKVAIVQGIKEQILNEERCRTGQKTVATSRKIDAKMEADVRLHSNKLVDLLNCVDKNFEIDWKEISVISLANRHSSFATEAMWYVYLHPSLNHNEWTEEENMKLLKVVKLHNEENWKAIAEAVGRRSDYQCFVQFQTKVAPMQANRWKKWRKSDDKRLMELVKKNTVNGAIRWFAVTAEFPNKSRFTIQSRYLYRLDPKISHAQFTQYEDLLLIAAIEEFGDDISSFARSLFPNRSLPQLTSRYKNVLSASNRAGAWSLEDDRKLLEFVHLKGESSWIECAKHLGNHSRISCRTRYLTIDRYFKKHPNESLLELPRKKRDPKKSVNTTNWLDWQDEVEGTFADFIRMVMKQTCKKLSFADDSELAAESVEGEQQRVRKKRRLNKSVTENDDNGKLWNIAEKLEQLEKMREEGLLEDGNNNTATDTNADDDDDDDNDDVDYDADDDDGNHKNKKRKRQRKKKRKNTKLGPEKTIKPTRKSIRVEQNLKKKLKIKAELAA